jgi:hypothetical protein
VELCGVDRLQADSVCYTLSIPSAMGSVRQGIRSERFGGTHASPGGLCTRHPLHTPPHVVCLLIFCTWLVTCDAVAVLDGGDSCVLMLGSSSASGKPAFWLRG